jgi:hypothetical protein
MSNKENTAEEKVIYTATFTLEQDGLKGTIIPKLTFNPKINPLTEEVPAIYEYMSTMSLNFLRQVRAIDENGEIVNGDEWDRVKLDLSNNTTH